jgi:hypothetical protein
LPGRATVPKDLCDPYFFARFCRAPFHLTFIRASFIRASFIRARFSFTRVVGAAPPRREPFPLGLAASEHRPYR